MVSTFSLWVGNIVCTVEVDERGGVRGAGRREATYLQWEMLSLLVAC